MKRFNCELKETRLSCYRHENVLLPQRVVAVEMWCYWAAGVIHPSHLQVCVMLMLFNKDIGTSEQRWDAPALLFCHYVCFELMAIDGLNAVKLNDTASVH